MEKLPSERGYAVIISEKLAQLGFEELITIGGQSERYIKVPQEFSQLELMLPDEIRRLSHFQYGNSIFVKIPFDSIPINALYLSSTEKPFQKYSGVASNAQQHIDEIQQNNPHLTDILEQHNISLQDLLIASVNEPQISLII